MKFRFSLKRKRLNTDVRLIKAFHFDTGLMFRTRNTRNLVFAFSKPCRAAITSFFVFFPFLAVWLDKNKKVIQWKLVRPFVFSLQPKRAASYMVELPVNHANHSMLKHFAKST